MLVKPLFKLLFLLMLLLGVTVIFAACSALRSGDGEETPKLIFSTTAKTTQVDIQEEYSEEDADAFIVLDDDKTIISGEGVAFESSVLTITKGGTYSIKGKLSDGKIYVNSDDEDKKVKLLLSGVDISCSTDAPIYIENSPKETILILLQGTKNYLSDTQRSVPAEGTDYATAAVYSKDDLQIEGSGSLYVTGNFSKGVFSKNDIDIRGGYIEIVSLDDGIRGKDSVEISSGNISITCGGDGIRTSETEQEGKGDILISGGSIKIVSFLDGIQAVKNAEITGGTINIISGGGATGNITADTFPGGMGGGRPGGMPGGVGGRPSGNPPGVPDSSGIEQAESDTQSTKGIKADGKLTLSGGSVNVSSLDDSIHAVNVSVSGGSYTLKSDDDGIHADEGVAVSGGTVNISKCYEGVEGKTIDISGGEISLCSVDDGFNAAGEAVGMMENDTSCHISITDGYVFIDAEGDGVDSNGSVSLKGGELIIFGPVSGGNGSLDYAGQFNVSGGTLLALGSSGMAQSVDGDGIGVLAFYLNQSADVLTAITDSEGDLCIAFTSTKQFSTVVYACENILDEGEYRIYQGGSVSGESRNGVCTDGDYTQGELLGSLDKSA